MEKKHPDIVIGQTYGCWTAVSYWGQRSHVSQYNCVCTCGNKLVKTKYCLLSLPESCQKCPKKGIGHRQFYSPHRTGGAKFQSDRIEELFNDPKINVLLEDFSKYLIKEDECWRMGGRRSDTVGRPAKSTRFVINNGDYHLARVIFRWVKGYLPKGEMHFTCTNRYCVNPDHMTFLDESKILEPVQIKKVTMAKVDKAYMFLPATTNPVIVDAYNKMRMLMKERKLDQADAQKSVIFEYKLQSQQQEFTTFVGRMNVFLANDAEDYPRIPDYKSEDQAKAVGNDLDAELSNRQIGETDQERTYYVMCHILDQIQLYGDKAPIFQSIFGKQGYSRNNWAMFNSELMKNNMLLFEIFSGAQEHLFDKDTLLVTFPRAMSFVKHVINEKNDIVNIALHKSYGTVKLELMFK